MILVLYSFYSNLPEDEPVFENLMAKIPATIHPSINRYKKREDRWSSLLGKLLVQYGFDQFGFSDVYAPDKIQYTAYNRPYYPSIAIDFNISHSGGCVVCAVSPACRLGIDVERKRPVALEGFNSFLHEQEWNDIQSSPDELASFYRYWTRKEAVVKANGKGLDIPLKDVLICNGMACLENNCWYLQEISLPADYICHLATDTPGNTLNIRIHEVTFHSYKGRQEEFFI